MKCVTVNKSKFIKEQEARGILSNSSGIGRAFNEIVKSSCDLKV